MFIPEFYVTNYQLFIEFVLILVIGYLYHLTLNYKFQELSHKLNVLDDRQRSDNDKQFNNYFNLDGLIKNHRHEKVMEEVPSKVVEMQEVDRVVW